MAMDWISEWSEKHLKPSWIEAFKEKNGTDLDKLKQEILGANLKDLVSHSTLQPLKDAHNIRLSHPVGYVLQIDQIIQVGSGLLHQLDELETSGSITRKLLKFILTDGLQVVCRYN